MISIAILINGEPIFTRSAHRRTKFHAKDGKDAYLLDDGQVIYHNTDDGAVALAHKMLDTIVEELPDAAVEQRIKDQTGKCAYCHHDNKKHITMQHIGTDTTTYPCSYGRCNCEDLKKFN